MPAPFLLRIHADDADLARRIARALEGHLGPRHLHATVQTAPASLTGSPSVGAGVWSPEGKARWLAPIPVPDDPEAAARHVVAFLESWGFIERTFVPAS